MDVPSTQAGDTHSFRIEGSLGVAAVATLKARMLETLKACREIVLDLEAVEDCDTAGIQLLVAATRAPLQGDKLIRIGPCSDVVRTTATKLGVRLMINDDGKGA
jgi:anti-anti-sigma regulatory factor